MTADFRRLELPYVPSDTRSCDSAGSQRVVVVGAGPVGLTVAIDLVTQGVDVVLLDEDHRLSSGSRAICFA